MTGEPPELVVCGHSGGSRTPYHIGRTSWLRVRGVCRGFPGSMAAKGFITLTLEAYPEGRRFVSRCRELDVTSCGDSLVDAFEQVKDAVTVYLNAIEQLGDRERIFAEKGIVMQTTMTDDAIAAARAAVLGALYNSDAECACGTLWPFVDEEVLDAALDAYRDALLAGGETVLDMPCGCKHTYREWLGSSFCGDHWGGGNPANAKNHIDALLDQGRAEGKWAEHRLWCVWCSEAGGGCPRGREMRALDDARKRIAGAETPESRPQ